MRQNCACAYMPRYTHEFAACASPRQHLRLMGIGCADAALLPTGLAIELGQFPATSHNPTVSRACMQRQPAAALWFVDGVNSLWHVLGHSRRLGQHDLLNLYAIRARLAFE